MRVTKIRSLPYLHSESDNITKNQGEYMIILIGGSSHVGKTFLAQKLLEKLKIPYLSLDHLKMMFIRGRLTDLTCEDDYEMRYFLWPYAAEIIKTAIENMHL